MVTGEEVWDLADDFDDLDEAPAPAPTPSAAPVHEAAATTTRIPAVRPAPAARPMASNPDHDNGVNFGSDPDFDFIDSPTRGAAYELLDRGEVLRHTARPAKGLRGRSRTETSDVDPAVGSPADLDDGVPTKEQVRQERIAANKEKRAQRAQEREEAKAARQEAKAARREEKVAHAAERAEDRQAVRLPGAAPDDGRNTKRLLIGAAACAVTVLAVGGIGYALIGGDEETDDQPNIAASTLDQSSTSPTQQAVEPAPVVPDCPERSEGALTTGRGAGDLDSGAGAILAFNYAFYVKRSAADAAAAVQPSSVPAMFTNVESLQNAINGIPSGTTHCLSITSLGNGRYNAELSQVPPGGGAPAVYHQLIQTSRSNGKTLIVSNQAR